MDLGVPFLMTIFVFGKDLLTEEETFLHVYESSQWQMFLVSFAWSSVGISLRLQYLEQLPVAESMDHALLTVSWQLDMVFTCLLISDHLLFAFSGETVPSGKLTVCYGKSPFFMGKTTINCHVQ